MQKKSNFDECFFLCFQAKNHAEPTKSLLFIEFYLKAKIRVSTVFFWNVKIEFRISAKWETL